MDSINLGESASLKNRTYELLKREILSNNFKPGDKLNISELASKLNISYSPVREALNLLCKEGLVELPPHKQAVIASYNMKDLKITIQLREMLEPYAASLSANLVPKEKLEEVKAMMHNVLKHPDNYQKYMDSDICLHQMFHEYIGSKTLSDILESLKYYNMRYRYINENSEKKSKREMITNITMEHLEIIKAFEERDVEKIARAVKNHIVSYAKRSEISVSEIN